MPWSKSAIFRTWIADALGPTPGFTGGWNLPFAPDPNPAIGTGDFRVALFGNFGNNALSPNEAAPRDECAFAGNGIWSVVTTIYDNRGVNPTPPPGYVGWPNGGPTLLGTGQDGGYDNQGGTVTFRADPAQSNGAVTMPGGTGGASPPNITGPILGDLTFYYDSSGPSGLFQQYQGMCFHYYGGPASVVNGTFTVTWPPEGVAQMVMVSERFPAPPRTAPSRADAVLATW